MPGRQSLRTLFARLHRPRGLLISKKVYINFEGVDSCFYLYINNKFAAYSQVSHLTSEIDITDYLYAGKNNIKLVVLKWCDGSYLEDQDMWRASGIFREVYLLYRDPIHINDVFVKPQVDVDLKSAKLVCEFDFNEDTKVEVGYTLKAADGSVIADGKTDAKSFTIDVESPRSGRTRSRTSTSWF